MYCYKCGKELTPKDNFCPDCGTKKDDNFINITRKTELPSKRDSVKLILAILSIALFWCPIISIPLAVAGLIIGRQFYKKTNIKSNATIISIISLIFTTIYLILVGIFFVTMYFYKNTKNDVINERYEQYQDEYFKDEYSENNDIQITGYKWQGTDSSILSLEENNNYTWYQTTTDYNNNFHSGTYKIYTGYEAIRYIATNLAEYGITEEDQLEIFKRGNYNINNYLLIILNCQYSNINGEETTEISGEIPYYGFYYPEEKKMSLINIKSSNIAEFKLIEENNTNEKYNNII